MFVIGHHDPARNSRALPTMAVWYSSPAADLQISWNSSIEIWNDIVCLVVWNIAFIVTYIYIYTHIGNNDPNWLSYFSEGVKPPTSCVLHLLQATKLRFQHVSTKPWRFFFNGCPKDFQIIHLGCHPCFGSQGLRGVIPHQNESRIEKCSNIYHSNIFFWAASNDAVCAAFFGTLFGGPLGPPVSSATAVPRPILVPPSATWFVRTTPWRRHRFVLRCFLRSGIHWIPIFLGVETARDGQSNQKIIGLTSICIHML